MTVIWVVFLSWYFYLIAEFCFFYDYVRSHREFGDFFFLYMYASLYFVFYHTYKKIYPKSLLYAAAIIILQMFGWCCYMFCVILFTIYAPLLTFNWHWSVNHILHNLGLKLKYSRLICDALSRMEFLMVLWKKYSFRISVLQNVT